MSESELTVAAPDIKKLSRISEFDAFRKNPFGRLTTAMAVILALAAGDQRIAGVDQDSSMHVRFESQGTHASLTFDDWGEPRASTAFSQNAGPHIEPNAALGAIVSHDDPLTTELGLTPPNIENPGSFSALVFYLGDNLYV